MTTSVTHHSDGRKAWDKDLFFLVRYRGILVSYISTLALSAVTATGIPWWFAEDKIILISIIVYTLIALGIIITVSLFCLRKRTIRSLKVKHLLHQFSHKLRDIQSLLENKPSEINFTATIKEYANLVQEYFKELILGKEIEVAIRIAKEEDNKPCYVTIARTSGFNLNRHLYSQPLQADKGLARYFQQKGCTGVLIYHDIKEAVKVEAYEETESDRKFPGEIKTMMCAGMNGWDGQKTGMLGILFLTSRAKKVFHPKYTDSLCFTADIGATIISLITNHPIYDNKKGG